MLTESEREWLEDREFFRHPYTCKWCDRYDPLLFFPTNKSIPCKWYQSCTSLNCPSQSDLQDAAEFSERVAARLATDENCGVDEDCPPNMPFGWGRLKAARLKVEEEMEKCIK